MAHRLAAAWFQFVGVIEAIRYCEGTVPELTEF